MIPPEPTPAVEYSYWNHSTFAVGDYTADFYQAIQDSDGHDCAIYIRREGQSSNETLSQLAIVNVTAFDQVNRYFTNNAKTVAIYADNATVGGTHPYYSYDSVNHTWVEAGTAQVISSYLADYFSDIKSGNFTLVQR